MSDYIIRVKTTAPRSQTLGLLAEFWNTDTPQGSLLELAMFLKRIANGSLPAISSVEVQANDVPGTGSIVIEPGRRPFPTSGQPAIGWVIVATSGNTVLTVGTLTVTQPFVTSQAVTAAMLIQQINQVTVPGAAVVGSLVTASLDPNGVAGKVILTANTLPWDHIIGTYLALSVTGTGASVSAATLGGSSTAPAFVGANAAFNGINL